MRPDGFIQIVHRNYLAQQKKTQAALREERLESFMKKLDMAAGALLVVDLVLFAVVLVLFSAFALAA